MNQIPKNFVFLSFEKIFAQFRKNLLSFRKILAQFPKNCSVFQEICYILWQNRLKTYNLARNIANMHWIQKVEYLKISYFSVLPIFLSFAKNWSSVSVKILSKKKPAVKGRGPANELSKNYFKTMDRLIFTAK